MHDLLRLPRTRCLHFRICQCVLQPPATLEGWLGNLRTGEEKGNQDLKYCASIYVQIGEKWLGHSERRHCQGRFAVGAAQLQVPRQGWALPLEERLLTIKFYLQAKEILHLILNHCFSPEALYDPERTCVYVCTCTQKSIHTLFLSVIRALHLEGLEAEGA